MLVPATLASKTLHFLAIELHSIRGTLRQCCYCDTHISASHDIFFINSLPLSFQRIVMVCFCWQRSNYVSCFFNMAVGLAFYASMYGAFSALFNGCNCAFYGTPMTKPVSEHWNTFAVIHVTCACVLVLFNCIWVPDTAVSSGWYNSGAITTTTSVYAAGSSTYGSHYILFGEGDAEEHCKQRMSRTAIMSAIFILFGIAIDAIIMYQYHIANPACEQHCGM